MDSDRHTMTPWLILYLLVKSTYQISAFYLDKKWKVIETNSIVQLWPKPGLNPKVHPTIMKMSTESCMRFPLFLFDKKYKKT